MTWFSLFLGIVIGLIVGFFGARFYFKRQLQKNPPNTEKMVRTMFAEMGRKPSEAQMRRIMRSFNQQYK